MGLSATDSLPRTVLQYATGGPKVSDALRRDIRTGWLFGASFLVLSSVHAAATSSGLGWGRRLLYSLGAGVLGGLLGRTRDMWSGFDNWVKTGLKPFEPLKDAETIKTTEAKRAQATGYPTFDGKLDAAAELRSKTVQLSAAAPYIVLKGTQDYSFQSKDPQRLSVSFYCTAEGDTVVCFAPAAGHEKETIQDAITVTHNSAAKGEAQRFEFAVTLTPGSTP